MSREDVKKHINEYLAMEWGLDDETDPPDEKWPFELEFVGRVDDTDYYRFDDFGDIYYATWSPELLCFESAGAIEASDVGARLRQMQDR